MVSILSFQMLSRIPIYHLFVSSGHTISGQYEKNNRKLLRNLYKSVNVAVFSSVFKRILVDSLTINSDEKPISALQAYGIA